MLSWGCQQRIQGSCVPPCDCSCHKHQIPLVFDALVFSLAASLLPWPLAPGGTAGAFVHEEGLAVLPAVTVSIRTKLNRPRGARRPGATPVPVCLSSVRKHFLMLAWRCCCLHSFLFARCMGTSSFLTAFLVTGCVVNGALMWRELGGNGKKIICGSWKNSRSRAAASDCSSSLVSSQVRFSQGCSIVFGRMFSSLRVTGPW